MCFIKASVVFYILSCLNMLNGMKSHRGGQLVLSNVLFRHGERTPIEPFPTDPWADPSYWPAGFGQLTNTGKLQGYELGQYLRQRYAHFFQTGIKPYFIVYVRSTNTDRTIMTALALLAGMFPPEPIDQWHPDMNWQPIPIHTIPRHLDHLVAFNRNCPKYQKLVREFVISTEYKTMYKKYRYLFNYLSQMTGTNVETFTQVRNIYSIFYIQNRHNKTLPVWSKIVYPGGDMEQIVTLSETVRSQTRQMARLRGGFLLKNMLTSMQKFLNEEGKPYLIWFYSGHDTSITTLLSTLKMYEHHIVPFAACLMMELWLYDGEPFVEIYYKFPNQDSVQLEIPNCGKSCPLERMYELYDDVLPDDFDVECKIGSSLFFITGITLLLCILGIGIFLLYRKMVRRSINHVSSYLLKKFDI